MARDGEDLMAAARERRDAERTNALGALRAAAGRRDADQERAIRLAADNLLDKALRRLRAGDRDAALGFADRALSLGLEGSAPGEEGSLAVHLFVWDALRDTAVGGQHDGWLDRAEEVDGALDGVARRAWRAALRSLVDEGELAAADLRRARSLAAGTPSGRDPFDGVDHPARVAATLLLLEGVLSVTG